MHLSIPEIIKKKRDGGELTKNEIDYFIRNVVSHTVQDCQIGAMLMAIFLNDMKDEETFHLTSSLLQSGDVLEWPIEWKNILVDKHSTGGVGDKVSIPLAPSLAACGLKVPMISGRGLDFTGGTLDKLESIPGFKVSLNYEELLNCLTVAGCFIAGQTDKLVPGDRELYKIRDVTATVQSIPLIVASIISKKAAEGISSLILDVKVGKAGFSTDLNKARDLAKQMISAGNALGLKTHSLLTKMDIPIGNTIGNSLEIAESIDCLKGNGPLDLQNLVSSLGGEILVMQGNVTTLEEGRNKIIDVLKNGEALNVFEKMLTCQGVKADVAKTVCHGDIFTILPHASPENILQLHAQSDGFITDIDGLELARVCRELGAGRMTANQELDLKVGVRLLLGYGDQVKVGDPLIEIHYAGENKYSNFSLLITRIEDSIKINDKRPDDLHRIIEVL